MKKKLWIVGTTLFAFLALVHLTSRYMQSAITYNQCCLTGGPAGSAQTGLGMDQSLTLDTSGPQYMVRVVGTQTPVPFAGLPATPPGSAGSIYTINNSSTTTWGANADGNGNNMVLVFWNGTHWTVIGK